MILSVPFSLPGLVDIVGLKFWGKKYRFVLLWVTLGSSQWVQYRRTWEGNNPLLPKWLIYNYFFEIGPLPTSFSLFFYFQYSWQLTNVYINFADDCIQTVDLLCRKQLLYQLSHDHNFQSLYIYTKSRCHKQVLSQHNNPTLK